LHDNLNAKLGRNKEMNAKRKNGDMPKNAVLQ